MAVIEKDRMQSFEIKTLKHNILCKCGKGVMVGTGAVRQASGASGPASGYDHQHKCIFFDSGFHKTGCGAVEWFSDKYPVREEREVPITPNKGVT
jgi:hypothetical protein